MERSETIIKCWSGRWPAWNGDQPAAIGLDGNRVSKFSEKPVDGESIINGGFFILSPKVLDYISGDEAIWEREPLERLGKIHDVLAVRHFEIGGYNSCEFRTCWIAHETLPESS